MSAFEGVIQTSHFKGVRTVFDPTRTSGDVRFIGSSRPFSFRNRRLAAFHCMNRGVGSAAGPRSPFPEKPRRRARKRSRYGSRCGVLLDYLGVDVYCGPFMRYACYLKPAAHASATARRTEHSYGRTHLVLKASCACSWQWERARAVRALSMK